MELMRCAGGVVFVAVASAACLPARYVPKTLHATVAGVFVDDSEGRLTSLEPSISFGCGANAKATVRFKRAEITAPGFASMVENAELVLVPFVGGGPNRRSGRLVPLPARPSQPIDFEPHGNLAAVLITLPDDARPLTPEEISRIRIELYVDVKCYRRVQ